MKISGDRGQFLLALIAFFGASLTVSLNASAQDSTPPPRGPIRVLLGVGSTLGYSGPVGENLQKGGFNLELESLGFILDSRHGLRLSLGVDVGDIHKSRFTAAATELGSSDLFFRDFHIGIGYRYLLFARDRHFMALGLDPSFCITEVSRRGEGADFLSDSGFGLYGAFHYDFLLNPSNTHPPYYLGFILHAKWIPSMEIATRNLSGLTYGLAIAIGLGL
jgi:hypothetical protein